MEAIIAAYNEAIFDTDRDRALQVVHEAEASGITPEDIVFKVVLPAMDLMVKSISENFDANLAQHFLTAQIADIVTAEMVAKFKKAPQVKGLVIIGTAAGDMHSLGKRIVIGCLKARMLDVHDLGVNVAPERFVDEALAQQAQVIGISAMMVHTARGENGCLRVRQLLEERGAAGRVRVIVGGAPFRFDPELYKAIRADAWAPDAVAAARMIEDMVTEVRP
jgi:methanogenic corrinoid protein MtbC1